MTAANLTARSNGPTDEAQAKAARRGEPRPDVPAGSSGGNGCGRTSRPPLLERHGVVRRIPLRRRRSRVPWIYSVYHARIRRTDHEGPLGLPLRQPEHEASG